MSKTKSTKKTGSKKSSQQPKPASGKKSAPKQRKLSLLDHAAAILAKHRKAMNCKEITDEVLAGGQWKTNGKTPDATLSSAIQREIKTKGKESRFVKSERGKFALKG